ncbi:MAG: DUF1440 domain-containing protein [Acidobacteria bacterium]|nr:DUF1440 domain-containing protein [Acidobacteriota bacterium]
MGSGRRARDREEEHVLKGVAAGLIGGLVASFVMNEFQALWSKVSESMKEPQGNNSSGQEGQKSKGGRQSQGGGSSGGRGEGQQSSEGGRQAHGGEQGQGSGGGEEQEPATVKAAEAISEGVFGHELTKKEKPAAGEAVHYAMGGASGAIYGALAELVPSVTVGAGIPFGTAVWFVADEAAVPALGLSKAPTEYPLSTHAYALVSHFVYGLTTDIVRRAVRSWL